MPADSLTTNYMLLRECGHLSNRKKAWFLFPTKWGRDGKVRQQPLIPYTFPLGTLRLGWKEVAQISPGLGQVEPL